MTNEEHAFDLPRQITHHFARLFCLVLDDEIPPRQNDFAFEYFLRVGYCKDLYGMTRGKRKKENPRTVKPKLDHNKTKHREREKTEGFAYTYIFPPTLKSPNSRHPPPPFPNPLHRFASSKFLAEAVEF